MPADPRYGSTSAGFSDAIARMQAQQAAIDALEAKEAELQGVEEKASGATRENISVRLDAAAAIERQTAASSVLINTLGREIEMLAANTEAWRANAIARGTASGESEGALASGAAAGGVGKARAPYVTPVSGERAAAGDAERVAAADAASLDAKLAAMQAATMASAQNVLRTSTLAIPQQQPALASGERRLLGSGPLYAPGGAGTYMGQGGALRLGEQAPAGAFVGGSGGLSRATTRTSSVAGEAGQFDTTAIGEYSAAEERLIAINTAVASSIEEVGAAQLEANSAFNLSVAEYAASSNALSKHGALSTEFIQSFAQGEVTLNEFGTALTATVGKFAGWAVAGAAVYGAFEGIKKVVLGAETGATGVAQLERAIPNVNKEQALEGFRSVSQRINVAPHQVAEAQFYSARAGFHSQPESLKASETALLATKLDEVPIQDATKGLGALHIAFGLNADAIHQVFNELDVGQLKFNARLNQTLPQMGRAASAFANAGGTAQQLASQLVEVVGATGGGGGSGGGNPATFLLREAASNLVRPSAEQTIRRYGYDPKWAAQNVGTFNEQLQNRAAIKPGQPGYLTPEDKAEIARAIGGGGAQGGRYGIALLNAGTSGRAAEVRAGLAGAGDSSASDLAHKKDQLNEQLASVGYSFERLGLELGTGGVTKTAEDFLGVLKLVGEGLEKAGKPLGAVGHVIGEIPGPVQQIGTIAALGAFATKFGRSDKALGLSKPLSELPGLGGLNSDAKEQLRHLQRTTSEGADFSRQQASRSAASNLSANYAVRSAVSEQARFAASREGQETLALSPTDTGERATALRSKAAAYADKITAVEARAQGTNEQLLSDRELEADFAQKKANLSDKTRSVQERVNNAAQEDLVAATSGKPQTPLIGAQGPVGTAYEASGQQTLFDAQAATTEGGIAVGAALEDTALETKAAGVGLATTLDTAAAQNRAAALSVSEGLNAAALQVREGGTQLFLAFKTLATEGALGLGVGGTKGVLGEGMGGLGGMAAGGAAGAGALFSGMGSKIMPAFFAAYMGSMISELIGSQVIGGKAGKAVGGLGSDVAVGAGLGMLFGAPEIGAAVGGGYGLYSDATKSLTAKKHQALPGFGLDVQAANVVGGLFGESELGTTLGKAAGVVTTVKSAQEKRLEGLKALRKAEGKLGNVVETGQEQLQNQAEGWAQEREAAQGTGESAEHAHANVEKREKVLAARAKLFGTSSVSGKRVQEEIRAEAGGTLGDITKNPANTDEYAQEFEKALEASTKPAQAALTRQLKHVKTPLEASEVNAEFQSVISANQKIVPKKTEEQAKAVNDAKKGMKEVEEAIAKLAGEPGGKGSSKMSGLRKQLEEDSKNAKSLGDGLKTLKEIGPKVQEELKEMAEAGAEAGLAAVDKINKTHSALKVAEAGANTGQVRKAEQERERTATREGIKFLGEGTPAQKLRAEEQKKEKVERQHKETVEGAEKLESQNALKQAELPITATKAQGAELKATGARELEEYVKKNAKSNAFGFKQIIDAEKAADEAKKAAEEAVNAEQQSLVGLRGQIAQAGEQGNAVAQAGTAMATAQKMMGLAKNEEERLHATLEMVTAHNQMHQAMQSLASSEGELAKSLAKGGAPGEAKVEIATDKKLLALAQGPEEKNKDQAALNTAKKSWTSALVTEREREIAFHEEMKEISKQQAVLQLQGLEKIGGKSLQAEQELKSKIRQLEKGATNNQVFSLAPGSIKLPTALDVQRAAGEAVMRSFSSSTASGLPRVAGITNQQNTITINVKDSHDVHKVGEELERITGGAMNTRMRKTGYRGS